MVATETAIALAPSSRRPMAIMSFGTVVGRGGADRATPTDDAEPWTVRFRCNRCGCRSTRVFAKLPERERRK